MTIFPVNTDQLEKQSRKKYAAIREQQNRYSLSPVTNSENMASAPSNGQGGSGVTFSRLASTWRNMKLGINNFEENVATKKLLPLRQGPETTLTTRVTTSSMTVSR